MTEHEQLPEMTEKDRQWRELIEERRGQAESFTWSVPGLAVAGQAFILSISLSPDVTETARLLASTAGVTAAIATLHFGYAKQVYLFDLYEGAIETERQRLRQPGLQLDELRAMDHPENTSYRKRKWEERRWLRLLVVKPKAGVVWSRTLAAFVVIDALLLLYALLARSSAPTSAGSGQGPYRCRTPSGRERRSGTRLQGLLSAATGRESDLRGCARVRDRHPSDPGSRGLGRSCETPSPLRDPPCG